MEWILAHLNLVMIVVFLGAGWFAKLMKKGGERSAPTPPPLTPQRRAAPQPARDFSNPGGSDDEVRRVQEEIRRKILERLSGRGEVTPPPVPRASVRSQTPPDLPASRPEVTRAEAMQGELARLEAERQAREDGSLDAAVAQNESNAAYTSIGKTNTWATELQNPESLRRAFVLSEVLGRPLSLR